MHNAKVSFALIYSPLEGVVKKPGGKLRISPLETESPVFYHNLLQIKEFGAFYHHIHSGNILGQCEGGF